MKTKFRPIIITVFMLLPLISFGQEITEKNYLTRDSELWMQYEQKVEELSKLWKEHPEKQDSIRKIFDKISEATSQKNRELAIQFVSVPSGLQRVFMVRLGIPKDTLQTILANLPEDMRTSPYGKSILAHIETEQIKEGDRYYDFQSVTTEGKEFLLSSLEGKNIFLLYGGLGCMGKDGRDYLNTLYAKTSRNDLEIVVYCPDSDLEKLQKVRTAYPCDFLLVSDFLQNHTPVKILYGAQDTPTCFFINKWGIVEMKTVGLEVDKVNQLLGLE